MNVCVFLAARDIRKRQKGHTVNILGWIAAALFACLGGLLIILALTNEPVPPKDFKCSAACERAIGAASFKFALRQIGIREK